MVMEVPENSSMPFKESQVEPVDDDCPSHIPEKVDDDDSSNDNPSEARWRIDLATVSSSAFIPDDNTAFVSNDVVHRQARFQSLLKRYQDQILYGCSESKCATPSCRSYQRRKAKGPFRPYTVLTARALATFLASQDHPENGLCPHSGNAERNEPGSCNQHTTDVWSSSRYQNASNSDLMPRTLYEIENLIRGVRIEEPDPQASPGKPADQHKDFKSFAQNFFDTSAIRSFSSAELSSTEIQISEREKTSTESTSYPRNGDMTIEHTDDVPEDQGGSLQDLNKEQPSFICQQQHEAWQNLHSNQYVLPNVQRDPQTARCVNSSAGYVLAYFSFNNCFDLFHHVSPKHTFKEDAEWCEMRKLFNRTTIALPDSFQPYSEYNEDVILFNSFVRRSVDYIFNTPAALLRSFLEWQINDDGIAVVRSYPSNDISRILMLLRASDDPEILVSNSWISLDCIDKSYSQTLQSNRRGKRNRGNSSSTIDQMTLSDTEAAHIAKIVFAALVAYLGIINFDKLRLLIISRCQSQGSNLYPAEHSELWDEIDQLENEAAVRLATRLAKALSSRQWKRVPNPEILHPRSDIFLSSFMSLLVRNIADCEGLQVMVDTYTSPFTLQGSSELQPSHCRVFASHKKQNDWNHVIIEWMRTVIIKEWDGKPEIPKNSAIGGALEFLKHMYMYCSADQIPLYTYQTPCLIDRLDTMEFPILWAERKTAPDMTHLLSYPFLFAPDKLVTYFRAINYRAMTKAHQAACINTEMMRKMAYTDAHGRGAIRVFETLRPSLSKYLVLDIRRDHILEDAIANLWRRKPSELMKPLKIRMGMSEGEEGVDLGGVSQEFFRLAIAEAMDPKYGAFTTDPESQMSWFRPKSFEPLHIYETVGILTSLAIYNGITLPFTFPRALYKAIPGIFCQTIEDISDGWPALARGFKALLDWPGDDVEEVFMRPYTFSTDAFGATIDIDMDQSRKFSNFEDGRLPPQQLTHPTTAFSDSSPRMVNNRNRHAFVRDYILHMTYYTVKPQLSAFLSGFRRCLPSSVYSFLTESSLKDLIEGQSIIDTHALEAVATYESGYHEDHPTIRQFWEVVHGWAADDEDDDTDNDSKNQASNKHPSSNRSSGNGQAMLRKLLEFVTASDRLPVGGESKLIFIIQRNGDGDQRLPSSMTCFGRLLLPEFSGIEALRMGLERAVREGMGFGLQ